MNRNETYRIEYQDRYGRWHRRRGGFDTAGYAMRTARANNGFGWRILDAEGAVVATDAIDADTAPIEGAAIAVGTWLGAAAPIALDDHTAAYDWAVSGRRSREATNAEGAEGCACEAPDSAHTWQGGRLLCPPLAPSSARVERRHSGTEDGYLWYVIGADGMPAGNGGGWAYREHADRELAHIAECENATATLAAFCEDATVTPREACAVVDWCREWASDCTWQDADRETIEDMPAGALLARCHRALDGGLATALDDCRRLAAPIEATDRYGASRRMVAGINHPREGWQYAPIEDAPAVGTYTAIYREGAQPSIYEQSIAAVSIEDAARIANREASARGLAVVALAVGAPDGFGAAILAAQVAQGADHA